MWADAKSKHPIGSLAKGVVSEHRPFGAFVDLGDAEAVGLNPIVEFADREQGRMTMERFPAIGTVVEVIVIWHDERLKQILLSTKPSRLQNANPPPN